MYKLIPTQDDIKVFFKLEGEAAERHGAIGFLRVDFGRGSGEFWSAWIDNQRHLKTGAFETEFEDVIHALRFDGNEPPFACRDNLRAFCTASPGLDISSRGDGYCIRTKNHSYYFRCRPSPNDYDVYCYAYNNRYLLPELAGQHELPELCYSTIPSSGELILIKVNEKGYYPCDASIKDPAINRIVADMKNERLGVTRAQEEAMQAGSMFGWEVPGAKPWKYNLDGTLRPVVKPKKNWLER